MEDGILTLCTEPVQHPIENLPIHSLLPGDSPRLSGESGEHIEALAQSEHKLPPILVHRQSMRVIDGMHRLYAAKLRGEKDIDVRFFDGDENAAFVLAVESNMAHGLPLSLADRTAAAARILHAQPGLSDRAIAISTGLAAATVAGIRARSTAEPVQLDTRIGRDGRVRPISSADGRKRASELIAKNPDASLREIARKAGVSPTTVRDVRERIDRGEDPIPPRERQLQEGRPSAHVGRAERTSRVRRESAGDPATILERLRKDPSFRLNAARRAMLRWLATHTLEANERRGLLDRIPPHSCALVAELARSCAERWNSFADELEQRGEVG